MAIDKDQIRISKYGNFIAQAIHKRNPLLRESSIKGEFEGESKLPSQDN